MYKTAEELGINDWEYEGLIKIKDSILDYKHIEEYYSKTLPKQDGVIFNMGSAGFEWTCGTVACIGGLLHLNEIGAGIKEAADYVGAVEDELTGLTELFFPGINAAVNEDQYDIDYSTITPVQASKAIENFLTTGCPNWEQVLEEKNYFTQ